MADKGTAFVAQPQPPVAAENFAPVMPGGGGVEVPTVGIIYPSGS